MNNSTTANTATRSSTTIMDAGIFIAVVVDGVPIFIEKTDVKKVTTIRNDAVCLEVGEDPMNYIYIQLSDVGESMGYNDINTLRDAIMHILNSNQNPFNEILDVLQQLRQLLNGNNDTLKEPVRIDDNLPDVIYEGYATDATADPSQPVWAIERITRDGDVLIYAWANGNKQFSNVWDMRKNLQYTPV